MISLHCYSNFDLQTKSMGGPILLEKQQQQTKSMGRPISLRKKDTIDFTPFCLYVSNGASRQSLEDKK